MSKTRAQLVTANIGVEHFVAHIKFNFQDDGHINTGPAKHVWKTRVLYFDLKNANCAKKIYLFFWKMAVFETPEGIFA